MSSVISELYERVLIKDQIWFVCKYNDCQEFQLQEQDIVSHISQRHMSSHNHRSDGELTAADNNEDIDQPIDVDIKPKIETLQLQTTVQTWGATDDAEELYQPHKYFRCHVNGCGKSFLYLKSLLEHKNRHRTQKPNISKNAAKTQTKPQFMAQTKAQTKQTANHNYNHIKDKYLRVQRLNDRSIHRWQKQDHRSDANYAGMQSLKNLGAYFIKDIVDDQKVYLCRYNQSCQFRTNRSQHMARHLNCCHFRTRIFRCSIKGCDRKYYNPTSLRQHTLNHKCGFGILNGKTMTTVCGNRNINRFRKRIIENELKLYKCGFFDCPFKTKSHSCIKRHIHDQHLCPNRVRYSDNDIVSEIMPKEQSSQQNSTIPQMELKSNIEIPEMIEIADIRRHSPVKRRVENTIEIIPMMQEMPNITGFPQMVRIPELIDLSDMPSLERQLSLESRGHRNSNGSHIHVHEVIDQLIGDEDYANECRKRANNLTNNNSDPSDDEDIQVIHEFIGQKRKSPDFHRFIAVKNIRLDYDINNFQKCRDELSKLNTCRSHFDVSKDQSGLRYVCKSCQFRAKSLEAISMHLRLKHFIDN